MNKSTPKPINPNSLNTVTLPVTQLVAIDSQVENYQTLATGVIPGTEVIILEANRNGVEQITELLKQKSYSTVHIISHGSPGCLYLGNSQLNLDNLNTYKNHLKTWFSPSPLVSQSPSLLIYGCNVAAGDAGAEFIAKLRNLTNAEIAASITPTGNKALGGNWQLEFTTNKLNAVSLAFQSDVMTAYKGVLAIDIDGPTTEWHPIVPSGVNAYDFSQDQQTGQTEDDIIGDNNDHLFYTQFDGIDDTSTTDGTLAFRVRVGQDKNSDGQFGSNLFIGIDADGNGAVDIIVGVFNQGNNSDVAIWNLEVSDPATDNTSPATTTIVSPPIVEVPQSASNYDFSVVDNVIDPNVSNTDINGDKGTDAFVSFSLDFATLVTQLGNLGFTVDETTPVNFVIGTATQDNSLNQDIGGIDDRNADKTITWTDSGAISTTLQLNGFIPGNGYSETLTGTTANDVIAGYKGQDTLTGGGGDDDFYFRETSDGIDIITDFDATSGDQLDFSDIAAGELSSVTITNNLFDDGYINAKTFGAGVMIQVDVNGVDDQYDKNVVLLANVSVGDIDAGDFIF